MQDIRIASLQPKCNCNSANELKQNKFRKLSSFRIFFYYCLDERKTKRGHIWQITIRSKCRTSMRSGKICWKFYYLGNITQTFTSIFRSLLVPKTKKFCVVILRGKSTDRLSRYITTTFFGKVLSEFSKFVNMNGWKLN